MAKLNHKLKCEKKGAKKAESALKSFFGALLFSFELVIQFGHFLLIFAQVSFLDKWVKTEKKDKLKVISWNQKVISFSMFITLSDDNAVFVIFKRLSLISWHNTSYSITKWPILVRFLPVHNSQASFWVVSTDSESFNLSL